MAAAIRPDVDELRAERQTSWEEVTSRVRLAAQVEGATVAVRLSLDEERRLIRTIVVMAAQRHEHLVRSAVAGLTRVESHSRTQLRLPLSPNEHDELLGSIPPYRARTPNETLSVAGVQLALDFRYAPLLNDLFADACYSRRRLVYQVHYRAGSVDPECLRATRKSNLRLESIPGVKPSLLRWQESRADELAEAAGIIEEFLMVDDRAAAEAVELQLRDAFRALYSQHGLPTLDFSFVEDGWSEALELGAHSSELDVWSHAETCGAAVDASDRDKIIGWTPSLRLAELLTSERPDADNADDVPITLVPGDPAIPVYEGESGYAFISYKREDLPRITPIVLRIQDLGIPVWYDRGIPGGSEWDAVIEEKLSHASIVVLFSSRAANESKYVRREVKFADALNTTVLTIMLEDVPLGRGMRMLLTQYQMLDTRQPDFDDRLRRALSHLLSERRTPAAT